MITIGNDGWLFYNSDYVLDDFLGLKKYSVGELEYYRQTIEDRCEWLSGYNILYLVAIIPNKIMIYPENLPNSIRQRQGSFFIDQFLEYIEKLAIRNHVIDLRPVLFSKKSIEQVYFRTDTHWTSYGAYIAYRELIERMEKWGYRAEPLNQNALKKEIVSYAGDLSMMLHLRDLLDEQVAIYTLKQPCADEDYGRLTSFVHPLERYRNPYYLPVYNGCPQKKGKILIIHDSFGGHTRHYFNETFNTVIYSDVASINDLDTFIIKLAPDVVIDMRVARNLWRLLQHNSALEKRILNKHLNSSKKILFNIKNNDADNDFVEAHDAQLSEKNDAIIIHSTGKDPYIVYHFHSLRKTERLFVHIIMTSPLDTVLQFFFTTHEDEAFNEEKAIRRSVKRGLNEFLFRLTYPEIQGKVRLDPGMAEGVFTLHEFSIHAEIWESEAITQ